MSFKPGDKVICTKDYICPFNDEKQFTAGKIYVVKKESSNRCYVEEDDMGNTDNGWNAKYFKLMGH